MKRTLVVVGVCAGFFLAAPPAVAQLTLVEGVVDALSIADTKLGMKDMPGQVNVGDSFTYRLNLRNNGPSDARGVIVQTRLAQSLTFVEAEGEVLPEPNDPDPPNVDCKAPSARLVNCRIRRLEGGLLTDEGDLLELGQRARVLITVTATQVGFPQSRATIESQNVDLRPGNNADKEGTVVR